MKSYVSLVAPCCVRFVKHIPWYVRCGLVPFYTWFKKVVKKGGYRA